MWRIVVARTDADGATGADDAVDDTVGDTVGDPGADALVRALRDAGHEVVDVGRCSPQAAAVITLQEDADLVLLWQGPRPAGAAGRQEREQEQERVAAVLADHGATDVRVVLTGPIQGPASGQQDGQRVAGDAVVGWIAGGPAGGVAAGDAD